LNKYLFQLLISIILIVNSTYAQTNKKHRIGLKLGIGHYNLRDKLVSPLMYSGYRTPMQLYYKYEGLKNRHSIQISYNNGEISSSVNNTADELAAGFRYGYHRLMSSLLNDKGKFFLGGIWDNYFLYRDYFFRSYVPGYSGYTDLNTWELVSSLNLSFLAEYHTSRENKFIFQTIIPFVAIVMRPSYSLLPPDNILKLKDPASPSIGEIFSAGDIVTLNNYFLVNLLFSYEKNISSFVNLRWSYSFTFYRISQPFKTTSVINKFDMDFIFVF